jgi:hypothetical protein
VRQPSAEEKSSSLAGEKFRQQTLIPAYRNEERFIHQAAHSTRIPSKTLSMWSMCGHDCMGFLVSGEKIIVVKIKSRTPALHNDGRGLLSLASTNTATN